MHDVLVMDEAARDRELEATIIARDVPEANVLRASTPEEALELLKGGSVSLLVAGIPRFDLGYYNFLVTVAKQAPHTQVLVTSYEDNRNVARNVWRLGVSDYLLKPFRGEWLVAAVRVMLGSSVGSEEKRSEWERNKYLALLDEGIRSFRYKKCTDTAREYLDLVFGGTDNSAKMRDDVLAFANGTVKLVSPLGSVCQRELKGFVERSMLSVDLETRVYDAYAFFERLLDRIFGLIEREGLCQATGIQRILTYIDRNVKRELSMVDAAGYASMSPSYFSKYFKRETGQNFIVYVTDRKIEYAKRMLAQTDFSIIRISSELSYKDANYFSKAFKKKTGVTPTEYRDRHGVQGARKAR